MTVVELLVGLGVLSILAAMLSSFLHVTVVAARVLAARIDAQETASMTVDIVGRELRMADRAGHLHPKRCPGSGVLCPPSKAGHRW